MASLRHFNSSEFYSTLYLRVLTWFSLISQSSLYFLVRSRSPSISAFNLFTDPTSFWCASTFSLRSLLMTSFRWMSILQPFSLSFRAEISSLSRRSVCYAHSSWPRKSRTWRSSFYASFTAFELFCLSSFTPSISDNNSSCSFSKHSFCCFKVATIFVFRWRSICCCFIWLWSSAC